MRSESERAQVVTCSSSSGNGELRGLQRGAMAKDGNSALAPMLPSPPSGFDVLIGASEAWHRTVAYAAQAAPNEITVLLFGETGTGKELLARTIHQQSARASGPFVRIDCTSLTPSLCESELYGHVRGAFTGATARRAGLIELAEGGTLLIDEIGDLPLELQPKLLRVLQEREFEPVGSPRTRRANVRVIAATNRDLRADVAAGRFRSDLYYRIAAFAVRLPPLREREGDTEVLAKHFLHLESRRARRPITGLSATTLARIRAYTWPGNVRELRHAIERACIVCSGSTLQAEHFDLPPPERAAQRADHATASEPWHPLTSLPSLREVERQHILTVLQTCRGVIEGKSGAARLLGIPPSTVRYRMRKLGIAGARASLGAMISSSPLTVSHSRVPPRCAAEMDSCW
jgi:transcriptional regulator with GAF, ATPase, and Fis domain